MAKTKLEGLDDLNKLLDSLTDPKFRARALRNAVKPVMEEVKQDMISAKPESIKDSDVVIKTKVNTGKAEKNGSKQGFIKSDKFNELYSEVTFKTKRGEYGEESAYGMATILNYGRNNPLARVRGDSKFHSFGKPTEESHRYIGVTQGLFFVEKVRFQNENKIAEDFGKRLLDEVEKEIKKQDKRNNRKK
ncbi:hypothetical protein ACLHZU_03630 [Aeromonas salmonicida]|uniref:hypothetical protein n=1 Tax=Aeromonas salmonicida TaxID=645 RepID=UPI003D02198F